MEFNERDTLDTPSRGYPVYKLLRAVNRQYPNNGFINYVDVREDMYDSMEGQLIDEDLRDLINETLQETYINIAQDEVYSFPTVPGQREYSLPENCDLRDIQEVTRTFGTRGCPPPPPTRSMYQVTFDPNGGIGIMQPISVEFGEEITLPECTIEPETGHAFDYYTIEGEVYHPGDTYTVNKDTLVVCEWKDKFEITYKTSPTWSEFIYPDTTAEEVYQYVTPGDSIGEDNPRIPEVDTKNPNTHMVFYTWAIDAGGQYGDYFTPDQIKAYVPTEDTLFWALGTSGRILTIRNATNDELYITVKTKVKTEEYERVNNLYYNATLDLMSETGAPLSERYEYIDVYFNSSLLLSVDLTTVLTSDTQIDVVHPVVPPDPEQPGDNDDNNNATPVVTPDPETPGDNGGGSSIDDPVDPIDNGDGGYGDTPLNGGE